MHRSQASMAECKAQRNTFLTNKDQKVAQLAENGSMPNNADALHNIPHDMARSVVIEII